MGGFSEMLMNTPVLMSLGPKLVLIAAICVLLARLSGRIFPVGIYILAVVLQAATSIYVMSLVTGGGFGLPDALSLANWGLLIDWIAPVTLLIMGLTLSRKTESTSSVEWNS